MRRLLTLFMVFTLVIANGTSVAGALCRHQSTVEHSAARKSDVAQISGAAFSEEAAALMAAKKGALADAGAVAWVADLPPGHQLTVPAELPRGADPVLARARPLVGRSLAPLLEPPAA